MASKVILKNNEEAEFNLSHNDGDGAINVTSKELRNKLDEYANVKDFGAVGDGVTDDLISLNLARDTGLNIYLPEGDYYISDRFVLKPMQVCFGDGVTKSKIVVDENFNMSASSIVRINGVEGGGLDDINIECIQPDVSTRVECIQYPYALDIESITRVKIGKLRISGAWNGINAKGNTGGLYAELLEVGALNIGIETDGALDFFHIGHYHFWPFGIANKTNLINDVYYDGTTIACDIKGVDGLDIQTLSTFRGLVNIEDTFGNIGTLQMDGSNSGLTLDDGDRGARLVIGNWYSSSNTTTGDFALHVKSGSLTTGAYNAFAVGLNPHPIIKVDAGEVMLGNGVFESVPTNAPVILQNGGKLNCGSIHFNVGVNTIRAEAFIKKNGGRMTLKNPRFPDKGTGTGNAFEIVSSSWDDIEVNALLGWDYSIPSASGSSSYKIGTILDSIPTVEFLNNGDFNPTYTLQECSSIIYGKQIHFTCKVIFDTNAYTTASTAFKVSLNNGYKATKLAPITIGKLANITFGSANILGVELQSDAIFFRLMSSGASAGNFSTNNIPASTSNIEINISGSYFF